MRRWGQVSLQNVSDKKFVKNAVTISVGNFLAKLLGAFYRIPLTNLLGSVGLGLYQMVFPVYCILLDFAGAGLPCGLSKLISENNDESKTSSLIKSASFIMFIVGIIGSALMLFLSKPLASLQGNKDASIAYVALSPAVFFVALISVYRGYFQGKENMLPTAVSGIIEQVVKLVFGLFFVLVFTGYAKKAGGATLAVTISEIVAFFYLFFLYKKKTKVKTKIKDADVKVNLKKIFAICLPITITSILIPFSQVIDSFLIINVIGKYNGDATSLYGLYSGGVTSVIGLPVSLCYGFAVAVLPNISKNNGSGKDGVSLAVGLTAVLSSLMALVCFLFPNLIVKILFFSLSAENKIITASLLRLSAVSIIFLSLMQTTNSCLVAKNRPYLPVMSLAIGILVKIILELILLPIPKFNVYGAAFSANVCYFVAIFVNLMYIIKDKKACLTGRLIKER